MSDENTENTEGTENTENTENTETTETTALPAFDFSKLDEDVQASFSTKKWDGITDINELINTVGKSNAGLEKKLGANTIAPPVDGDLGAFFKDNPDAFGLVKGPDDYQIERVDMPEGVEWDEAGEKALREYAHEKGWPQSMVQDALTFEVQQRTGAMQGAADQLAKDGEAAMSELKADWGQAFAAKESMAKQAAQAFGLTEAQSDKMEKIMGTADLVRGFAKIGEMLGEDVLKGGDTAAASGGMTPAEAKSKMNEMREKDTRIKDRSHPDHKAAMAEFERLGKLAYSPGG